MGNDLATTMLNKLSLWTSVLLTSTDTQEAFENTGILQSSSQNSDSGGSEKPWNQVISEGPSNSKAPLSCYFLWHGSEVSLSYYWVNAYTMWSIPDSELRNKKHCHLRSPVFLRQVMYLFWSASTSLKWKKWIIRAVFFQMYLFIHSFF